MKHYTVSTPFLGTMIVNAENEEELLKFMAKFESLPYIAEEISNLPGIVHEITEGVTYNIPITEPEERCG